MIVPFKRVGAMDINSMPPQTDDIQAVFDNLGQQMSALVHQLNQMRQDLMAQNPSATKEQFMALLNERKSAMDSLIQNFQTQLHAALPYKQVSIAQLQGLGQTSALDNLQTQIATEQAKLTALQTYFTQYKAAVDSGAQPPPLPEGLQSGFMGLSSTMLIAGVGLIAALFLFGRK